MDNRSTAKISEMGEHKVVSHQFNPIYETTSFTQPEFINVEMDKGGQIQRKTNTNRTEEEVHAIDTFEQGNSACESRNPSNLLKGTQGYATNEFYTRDYNLVSNVQQPAYFSELSPLAKNSHNDSNNLSNIHIACTSKSQTRVPVTPSTVSSKEDENYIRPLPATSPESWTISPIKPLHTNTQGNTSPEINSAFSDGVVCRICHCDGSAEQLLSPCFCSGSVGLLHLSCLQTWLGSSNKTICELCHFKFTLQRKTKPLYKYLQNPGTSKDKRYLICDIVSAALLTPLTVVTSYLCMRGAAYYDVDQWEAIALFILVLILGGLFCLWFTLCLKQNIKKWRDWATFNKEVKLVCKPPKDISNTSVTVKKDTSGWLPGSPVSLNGVKISRIEIKINPEKEDRKKYGDSLTSPRQEQGKSRRTMTVHTQQVMRASDLPTTLRREDQSKVIRQGKERNMCTGKSSVNTNPSYGHKKQPKTVKRGHISQEEKSQSHEMTKSSQTVVLCTSYSMRTTEKTPTESTSEFSSVSTELNPTNVQSTSSQLQHAHDRSQQRDGGMDVCSWKTVCSKETYI